MRLLGRPDVDHGNVHGEDVIIVPSLQDPEVISRKFPKGFTAVRPYLRVTPQPDR